MLKKEKFGFRSLLFRALMVANFFATATSFSEIIRGKHLLIATSPFPVGLTVERNSSGYIISMDGISPRMLEWLKVRYNFSYSIIQVNRTTFEGSSTTPGPISYLTNGKCDLIMGTIAMTNIRLPLLDFSQGYFYSSIAFMIPMPTSNSNNIAAVVKPFQFPVWIAVLTILPCVLAALYFSSRYRKTSFIGEPSSWFSTFLFYIFGVLLNQGAYCPDKRLFIRIIATAWCLAAFVLVTSYNSLLISYVTSPITEPLIHSIQDLSNVSSIHIVVDFKQGLDAIITNGIFPNGSIYKDLKDKLRNYPKSRCLETQKCVDLVKSGNHVYIATLLVVLDAMKKDFQTTGNCDLTLAKKKEPGTPGAWVLAKHSPFTEYINRGILEMFASGLLDIWTQWYQPDVRLCLDKADKMMQLKPSKNNPPQLSLTNLTGAFVVLSVGYIVSFLVFWLENFFLVFKNVTGMTSINPF